MTTTTRRARRWIEPLGRAGLGARGITYFVVGWLALLVARGHSDEHTDRQGALAAIARQPLGRWLLVVLAVGFAGYAAWRLAEAATGSTSTDDDAAWPKRLAALAKAAIYGSFAVSAAALALHGKSRSGGDQQQTWTTRVLGLPMGRPLVVVAGLVVIGAGAANVWRGVTHKFLDQLKRYELNEATRPAVKALGTAGHLGRGLAFGLVGLFLVQAALDHDPGRARGLDGALHTLAGRSYGPAVLVAVAVGLACFGVYSLAESRWRRVLRS